MKRTVSTTNSKIYRWNGKVIIEEAAEYEDNRGSLTELWRNDDGVMCDGKHTPQMSYWSVTKPYVMRGPHQHESQTDWFYTFKSKMSYHLYDPETDEMLVYITDPEKVTRVKVAPPIIHSYRNLTNSDVMTANFPSSLFMGENKDGYQPNKKIDEIRWEEKLNTGPVFIVLGSSGRLGRYITKYLFDNMGMHKWDVIPVEENFHSDYDVNVAFSNISNSIDNAHKRDIYVINCAAATNVGCEDKNEFNFINTEMPVSAARECSRRNWKLIQLSSDYVYQRPADETNIYFTLSPYTMSKKRMEMELQVLPKQVKDYVYIFRVANLFSKETTDSNNLVSKFWTICSREESVKIDSEVVVFPTDVEILAKHMVDRINEGLIEDMDKYDFPVGDVKNINMVPEQSWNLKDLLINYFSPKLIEERKSHIVPWHKDFANNALGMVDIIPTSEMSIINTIEEYNYIKFKKEK